MMDTDAQFNIKKLMLQTVTHLKSWLPFVEWGRRYHWRMIPADTTAGMLVATMLVPQSMAYAALAGLPPIMGLYTSVLPVLLYGLLGSTPVLTLGPTAITSVMVLSTLQPLADSETDSYISLAIMMAFILGAVFMVAGLLKLGWVVNFLSRPVLLGYVNAAALIIAFSQLEHLLGIDGGASAAPYDLLIYPMTHLNEINGVTFLLGVLGIGMLFFARYRLDDMLKLVVRHKRLRLYLVRSTPLAVIGISTLIVGVFRLDVHNDVMIVGDISGGLPALVSPTELNWSEHTLPLFTGALAIAFVGFMEGVSTANAFATQKRFRIDSNQELFAMGVANMAAGMSGGYPATTSISRSAVNYDAGARTGMSSVIAALLMLATLLILTPLFYFLPRVTLSVIIVSAIINLIDFSVVPDLWRFSRVETASFFVTFIGVFVAGIEVGIVGGILVGYTHHIYRTSRPYIAVLGRVGNTENYVDIRHFPSARLMARTLIIRIDESLYFGNIRYLESFLREKIAAYPHATYIVLSFESVNRMDGTALDQLSKLIHEFDAANITILVAALKPQVFRRLRPVQFEAEIGPERFFASIHDAIRHTEDHPDLLLEEYHI